MIPADMINIVRLDGEISDKQIKDEMKRQHHKLGEGKIYKRVYYERFIYKCKERVQ